MQLVGNCIWFLYDGSLKLEYKIPETVFGSSWNILRFWNFSSLADEKYGRVLQAFS